MVGWHLQLDGHEFEEALVAGDGQGSLACCSPWGRKELNMTERLKDTNTISLWETPCNVQSGTRLADLGRMGGLGLSGTLRPGTGAARGGLPRAGFSLLLMELALLGCK